MSLGPSSQAPDTAPISGMPSHIGNMATPLGPKTDHVGGGAGLVMSQDSHGQYQA